MYPSTLAPGTLAADSADHQGFKIGWDHAHHGLVPPMNVLQAGGAVHQGWAAARAVFRDRTLGSTRPVRQWLQLRLQAWLEGVSFDDLQLTPNYLAQLAAQRCPVTLRTLGGTGDDAAVLQRLHRTGGFAAGALAQLSAAAARAMASLDAADPVADAQRRGRLAGQDRQGQHGGLDANSWSRLAVLCSFVRPLPHHRAAALPLVVLPPNRVRVLNAIQALQVVLTWQLATPGWSLRLRQTAARIACSDTRHEFMLFVGALAPRVMALPEADQGPSHALQEALSLLWCDTRVQRRWLAFALALGEAGAEDLTAAVAAIGLRGRRVLLHTAPGAVDGWTGACDLKLPDQAELGSRDRLDPD